MVATLDFMKVTLITPITSTDNQQLIALLTAKYPGISKKITTCNVLPPLRSTFGTRTVQPSFRAPFSDTVMGAVWSSPMCLPDFSKQW